MSTMPAQRRGSSEQTVCTPRAFLDAVEKRFGRIGFDLAATRDNSVAGANHFGPDAFMVKDALIAEWPRPMLCWLNPPYGLIKGQRGFAHKAAVEAAHGVRIVMLVPAAVATNWYADEIHGRALVLPIRPRLTFVGHKDPYPKDLMVCAYNLGAPGFEPWRWA